MQIKFQEKRKTNRGVTYLSSQRLCIGCFDRTNYIKNLLGFSTDTVIHVSGNHHFAAAILRADREAGTNITGQDISDSPEIKILTAAFDSAVKDLEKETYSFPFTFTFAPYVNDLKDGFIEIEWNKSISAVIYSWAQGEAIVNEHLSSRQSRKTGLDRRYLSEALKRAVGEDRVLVFTLGKITQQITPIWGETIEPERTLVNTDGFEVKSTEGDFVIFE